MAEDGKTETSNAVNAKEEIMAATLKSKGTFRKRGTKKHRLRRLVTAKSEIQDNEGRAAASVMEAEMKKKRALLKFRCMVQDAILENYLVEKPKKNMSRHEIQKTRDQIREIRLWGVPLLPSKGHEGTDTVLLKFLTARDYKVHEAFEMLRKSLRWRRDYRTDSILDEDLDLDLGKNVKVNSYDRQGRPLYYNAYGGFKNKEMYSRLIGTEENREKYLRCRIQFMEKCIKLLSFKSGEPDSIIQITDLKNSPPPDMKEFRLIRRKAFQIFQANYPEIIQKEIFINVPFWYYTSHSVTSKIMNPRIKKRFILVRPSKVTKTLLKYISPESLLSEYGGLRRDEDPDFSPEDKASELTISATSAKGIQIAAEQGGVTVMWDLTVVGWDVGYKEEFIPDDEGSYKVLLQKQNMEKRRGESVRNSFYISEPGQIVINIDNETIKKKRVYYRSKSKPTVVDFMKQD